MANFSYKEQLENQLWLNKRAEILQRDGFRCRYCGETKCLQVHHKQYIEGRLAWEYDNSDLITLCKSCHAREHNGGSNEKMLISSKKVIIFRSLLSKKDLKPTTKIVYSYLAAFAMAKGNKQESSWYHLQISNITVLTKLLHISRKTYYSCIKELQEAGYEREDYIYVPKSLFEKGYFELYNLDKVKGELLIFYSYLKSKAERYGNIIDTFKTKLAEELNTTKTAITKLLNRLYKINLAKRLDDGKLLIM